MRPKSICTLLLFFIFTSLIGWLWEAAVFAVRTSFRHSILEILIHFRGVLHGPWVPIYGVGCIMALGIKKLCHAKKAAFLICAMISCAVVEYAASWVLEMLFHAKWWDYSNQLFQLNGRICLGGILLFGIGGYFAAYYIEPWFHRMTDRFRPALIRWTAAAATAVFMADLLFSLIYPNKGIGVMPLS